jgi:hypothetical protein
LWEEDEQRNEANAAYQAAQRSEVCEDEGGDANAQRRLPSGGRPPSEEPT